MTRGPDDPSGSDVRHVLWQLRARASVMKCVLTPLGPQVELQVYQDEEVALREVLPDEASGRRHAERLRERLVAKGWRRIPFG